jgi:hypothetical protein
VCLIESKFNLKPISSLFTGNIMSSETPNPSADQENTQDPVQAIAESVLKDAVDPRDLVMKGGYTGDPREIVANPAVAPQMIDDTTELRDDLRRD